MAGLFAVMLLLLLISEIVFLNTVDKNTQELKVKKDILRNFQLRSYLSICIEGFIRDMWEIMIGGLALGDLDNFPPGIQIYFAMTASLLQQLVDANMNLRQDTTLLPDNLKGLLYSPN
ncbi:MAG: hypothetical protein EOO88_45395, partial [Pedobacter sp.]